MPARAADPHVVILGGGFGGLYAARVLGAAGARVTLADRRNFHLFQPLLYQVATGGLSPGDIASPIRGVLRKYPRAAVIQAEATDLLPDSRQVVFRNGPPLTYDHLIIATGSRTAYFGHDAWREHAPGLKSVEDALDIRQRVLSAFERAETESDEARRAELLTFVVVGGGPTGVELAGAVAELARGTLAREFRVIDPRRARVVLVEAGERLLPALPAVLARNAARSLEHLGVEIQTGVMVSDISGGAVTLGAGDATHTLSAATVLWAAGVAAGSFGDRVADRLALKRDRGGRVRVHPDLTVPGHPEISVIGDLALAMDAGGNPLPGLAPVAMQEGRYVARRILGRAPDRPFRYVDKGQLAVIGRNRAVADFGRVRFSGFAAWIVWVFVHIMYLIEYDNRVLVMVQWAFSYVTRNRGARLITRSSAREEEAAQ
ncbi:MAG TPA: NAD(P)/FAD-dependent oxidoreductase [Candidatus Krumholzibacteria bacterium]|nr:NAD(P)/FAD-dependent oxidoreductase [Candidatus Krumholzibacteria bacterium]